MRDADMTPDGFFSDRDSLETLSWSTSRMRCRPETSLRSLQRDIPGLLAPKALKHFRALRFPAASMGWLLVPYMRQREVVKG